MSTSSPSKEADPEGEVQSPDNDEKDSGENQQSMFDFDIKEQDRWLPIANGEFHRRTTCMQYRSASKRCTFSSSPAFLHRILTPDSSMFLSPALLKSVY